MYTVNALSSRFGLSTSSVRERLSSLNGLVDPYTKRGRNNAIMLTDGGMAIFDRMIQLERDGNTTITAIEIIKNERLNNEKTLPQPNGNHNLSENSWELVEELRARVDEQVKMISYLQGKLDETLAKVPALPAPKTESSQPPLSRWAALRIAVLGR